MCSEDFNGWYKFLSGSAVLPLLSFSSVGGTFGTFFRSLFHELLLGGSYYELLLGSQSIGSRRVLTLLVKCMCAYFFYYRESMLLGVPFIV